ncbi:restriction endonuclease [Nocardioides kongjuensis]|uniref:Restriction endonuclease type IV Mrr domain-containing protein n=1 Tax=Nocardioides kongjuensis TaxID=349522 RepID=A0A852RQ47_9ACTN|nr:restriction endonuclease [Nocardioides kongjuensis]NYD30980.1 hypothetical protein [Nocardioides kongjuensis]
MRNSDHLERLRQKYTRHKKARGERVAPGEFLESYVSYMYESLLSAQAGAVSVRRNARVTDNIGATYQIDVLFEFNVGNLIHRVVVECKDTARKTERDEAIAFEGKLRHMSNTVGVFISVSGFQPSALQYLDQHGIEHLDGASLPTFGEVVAARIRPLILPSENAMGQPFWALMHVSDGRPDGSWYRVPDELIHRGKETAGDGWTFVLFDAHRHAVMFQETLSQHGLEWVVRGIEQPMLRLLTRLATDSDMRFGLAETLALEGRICLEFTQVLTAAELAGAYLVPRYAPE